MKALYNYLVLLLWLIALNTSCLKAGLDDLETYNQNDITNVRFEYRWWDESGKRLRVMEMTTEKTIDNKAKKKSFVRSKYLKPHRHLQLKSEIRFH